LPSSLSTRIKQCAINAGFELCGIAPVGDLRELQVFPDWIASGKHGEMKYMEARNHAGELKREALARVAPWARSVIVCALNYNTAHPYSTPGSGRNEANHRPPAVPNLDTSQGWISRYAWGHEDYHDAVLRRLRNTEGALRSLLAESQHSAPSKDLQLRSYVDTGPLIERVYAKYAGIGWMGKNTCIINQQLGSWLFLGVILTSLDVLASDVSENDVSENEAPQNDTQNTLTADMPAPDRCGTCTRCITACPTQAITAPGELDARLCISYLTIEKRGDIPAELRRLMGRHVFGCDICQDVCPWNSKAPITSASEFEPRQGLVNPSLNWLAELQPEEFQTVFRGSPVKRAKLSGIKRNALIAMGNSGNKKFLPTLEKLSQDPDQVVAEQARWAQATLGKTS
jgi:epoxyqueuosine reductase